MSSEYGRRSPADMRAAQKDRIGKAEAVHPTVAVTEPNWRALIASQKEQVRTLGEILEALDTLTTNEQLTMYMDRQLELLQADGQTSAELLEQYRQTLKAEVTSTPSTLRDLAVELTKQAGSMSAEFGKALSQAEEQTKRTSNLLLRLSMVPSLITLLLDLAPRIWQLIFTT